MNRASRSQVRKQTLKYLADLLSSHPEADSGLYENPDGSQMTDEECRVIGSNMTEAEARVCATALNEHDRKVRGVKS